MWRIFAIVFVSVATCRLGVLALDTAQMLFAKYANATVEHYTPVETFSVVAERDCHFRCLSRYGCVAVAVSGSSCSLYDHPICRPTLELHSQPGSDVYTEDPCTTYVVSLSLSPMRDTAYNRGKANFMPQLAATKAGTVVRWHVRCMSEGTVWLGMWRPVPDTSNTIRLIGKNRITVPAEMVLQLVEHRVPAEEQFSILPGDYVGFHYDVTKIAKVVYDSDPALHKEQVYMVVLKDDELPVGVEITPTPLLDPAKRAPVVAVHIAP